MRRPRGSTPPAHRQSFTVAQRTREIGIRTELGAQPLRLMLSVFGRAVWQIAGMCGDCCSTTGVFAIKLTSTSAPYGFLKMSMRSSCMTL
jgi:hypothetical protein